MRPTVGDRVTLYSAVAGLFAPPSSEMLDFVGGPGFIQPVLHAIQAALQPGVRQLARESAAALRETARAGDLGDLQLEYTRLFEGPGTPVAPPWESAWVSEPVEGPGIVPVQVVELVAEAYRAAGCKPDCSIEPVDYLLTELDFLITLCERPGDGGPEDLGQRLHDQFFREHFSLWIPRLAETIQRETRLRFYADAARILAAIATP